MDKQAQSEAREREARLRQAVADDLSAMSSAQRALAELRQIRAPHAEQQRVLFRRMHGHFCSALVHLANAADYAAEVKPELCGRTQAMLRGLAKILPDYQQFEAATRKPRPMR